MKIKCTNFKNKKDRLSKCAKLLTDNELNKSMRKHNQPLCFECFNIFEKAEIQ